MRRILIVAVALVAVAVAAPVALGGSGSPHFITIDPCVKNSNGSITCTAKAAGLDSSASAYLSADRAEAVYQCQNKGGNLPPGQPVSSGKLIGPATPGTNHNGQITFSPTLGPPPAPSVADSCPNAKTWKLKLISITYYNVVLHVQQNGSDVLTHNYGTVDP
jgi:hypothetical protein